MRNKTSLLIQVHFAQCINWNACQIISFICILVHAMLNLYRFILGLFIPMRRWWVISFVYVSIINPAEGFNIQIVCNVISEITQLC